MLKNDLLPMYEIEESIYMKYSVEMNDDTKLIEFYETLPDGVLEYLKLCMENPMLTEEEINNIEEWEVN